MSGPKVSPYLGLDQTKWKAVTARLVRDHPLRTDELVEVVKIAWDGIFETRIAGFQIGKEIEPQPQIMGFLLHELIPLEFKRRYPKDWRGQKTKAEKDLVYIPDAANSVEIKTSSNASQIFGNRSYAQPGVDGQIGRKGKSGYYLTINFDKFGDAGRPELRVIRFGWLDHEDWIAQRAATGQQARVRPEAYASKLVELYKRDPT
jgi:hypothetical protein